MAAYYNEIDAYAAQWLRNLIAAGLIAPGDVDERSIEDVLPVDVAGYAQCHFFAGIGGWSYALRLAGWPDERPVWTGSCPCQPFSAAGKRGGFADERHLWPAWAWLIRQCRPPVVFGEQVASKDGRVWFDLVSADLESLGYAVGAVDLPAAGVGAPHIRQRLWFVGHCLGAGLEGCGAGIRELNRDAGRAGEEESVGGAGANGGLANAGTGRFGAGQRHLCPARGEHDPGGDGPPGGLAEPDCRGRQGPHISIRSERQEQATPVEQGTCRGMADAERLGLPGEYGGRTESKPANRNAWAGCDWLPCRDGKVRPVEPGTFPLAYGIPARVGKLRAYGNAIVVQVAAEVIRAYMETIPPPSGGEE